LKLEQIVIEMGWISRLDAAESRGASREARRNSLSTTTVGTGGSAQRLSNPD
jgi:hypothetical protein